MKSRLAPQIWVGMRSLVLLLALSAPGCSSIEVVRARHGVPPPTRSGGTPVTVQARCLGFYLATIGLPRCDLNKVINKMLLATAGKLGASHVDEFRFEGTPENGWWWITKLLWFRSASASGVVVIPPSTSTNTHHGPRPAPDSTSSTATTGQRSSGPSAGSPGSR